MDATDLIKKWEGCSLTAYLCPAGVPTIGYGHTGGVALGQAITQQRANELLAADVQEFSGHVGALCPNTTPSQFAALVSFAFNVGRHALESSTLRRKYLAGDIPGAADQFLRWNKATVNGQLVELPGLTRRRADERRVFLGLP